MANRRIDSLLATPNHRRSGLTNLLRQAALRDAWSAQLRALLPGELRVHCEVAVVQGAAMTILVDNAAWATRLRFLLPDLLPELNQLADFGRVRDIQIRVAPNITGTSRTMEDPEPRRLPDRVSLLDLADDVEYAALRAAILRLARHGEM